MKLITVDEFNTNSISVTSYYSSTGTIAAPLNNAEPKPEKRIYKASNIGIRVFDAPVPNIFELKIRTIELIDLITGNPITNFNTNELDTNSTGYNSDMNAYFDTLTTAITAYYA